jgi:hypothetical protein
LETQRGLEARRAHCQHHRDTGASTFIKEHYRALLKVTEHRGTEPASPSQDITKLYGSIAAIQDTWASSFLTEYCRTQQLHYKTLQNAWGTQLHRTPFKNKYGESGTKEEQVPAGHKPSLKSIGYSWSYLECIMGILVPIWQPYMLRMQYTTLNPTFCMQPLNPEPYAQHALHD